MSLKNGGNLCQQLRITVHAVHILVATIFVYLAFLLCFSLLDRLQILGRFIAM